MTDLPPRARLAALLLLVLAACAPARVIPPVEPPRAALAAPDTAYYRSFASSEALAAALRYGSPQLPLFSAHRGGHGPAHSENAIETFAHTLRYAPALIEADVRLTRDSVLVLLHDETLDRTTTGSGRLDAHTLAEVRTLRLRDDQGRVTDARVPTLAEALAWAEGRAVYTIDVKRDVPAPLLVDAIRRAGAENRVVVITYTTDDLATYLALAPDLVYSIPATSAEVLASVLAVPGFDAARAIGFVGVGSVPARVVDDLHRLGIAAMVGVFGENEDAIRRGDSTLLERFRAQADVIATGAVPTAASMARTSAPD